VRKTGAPAIDEVAERPGTETCVKNLSVQVASVCGTEDRGGVQKWDGAREEGEGCGGGAQATRAGLRGGGGLMRSIMTDAEVAAVEEAAPAAGGGRSR
jgi:expansin (peptidoglycan-binding protein)